MQRTPSAPEVRTVTPVHIALGTFLLLWLVMFLGLAWGNSGYMPRSLMAMFDFVFVDVLYTTGWHLWMNLHPTTAPIGFYAASAIGYAIAASFVAVWFHVLSALPSSPT